jgi:hypothetical protein
VAKIHSEKLSGWYPSEKYESQLGWLFPIYGKIKNVPNHQSDNLSLVGYKPRGGAAKTGFAHRKFRKTTNRGDPDVVSSKSGCFYYEKWSNHVKSCGYNAEIWNKLKLEIWEGMQNLFQSEGFIWNQLNQNGRESEKKRSEILWVAEWFPEILCFNENVVPHGTLKFQIANSSFPHSIANFGCVSVFTCIYHFQTDHDWPKYHIVSEMYPIVLPSISVYRKTDIKYPYVVVGFCFPHSLRFPNWIPP